ncbi:MAG TPA: allulose-6-phosphate 3-epimerase [Clostridia bacterium]|nr:allulose-6-phosphate 3-epimerase [Clostridia bacterium]
MPSKPRFAASLMCLDFLRVQAQLEVLNRRADMLHVDIMDGHFAPNLALTPDLMQAFRRASNLPMDAHLMTTQPGEWVDRVAEAGAHTISLPREALDTNAFRLLRRVEALGCRPGLVLCPATPLSLAEHLLEVVDMLTVMTVDVGYAGQAFIPQMLQKLEQARNLKERHGYHYTIQVDGACNRKNFAAMRLAGAEQFILGSSLFGNGEDLDAAYDAIMADFAQTTGEDVR